MGWNVSVHRLADEASVRQAFTEAESHPERRAFFQEAAVGTRVALWQAGLGGLTWIEEASRREGELFSRATGTRTGIWCSRKTSRTHSGIACRTRHRCTSSLVGSAAKATLSCLAGPARQRLTSSNWTAVYQRNGSSSRPGTRARWHTSGRRPQYRQIGCRISQQPSATSIALRSWLSCPCHSASASTGCSTSGTTPRPSRFVPFHV